MTFTLEKLQDSIAGLLKRNYPDVPVYGNPNQQGTKTPCFFVFFMPSDMESEMGRRTRRVIGVDIVYLTRRNIPDAYCQLTTVADRLDEAMEQIPYADGRKTTQLWTSEREWKIDDRELHYQFKVKAIVSIPENVPPIESMESYTGDIKKMRKEGS